MYFFSHTLPWPFLNVFNRPVTDQWRHYSVWESRKHLRNCWLWLLSPLLYHWWQRSRVWKSSIPDNSGKKYCKRMKISTTQGVVIQEAIQCSEFLSKTKPSCSWGFDFTFKSTLTLEVKDGDTQSTNYKNHYWVDPTQVLNLNKSHSN